jgi:hypothetical protein
MGLRTDIIASLPLASAGKTTVQVKSSPLVPQEKLTREYSVTTSPGRNSGRKTSAAASFRSRRPWS